MSLNGFFDAIPRTHLFRYHGNWPAYRTCGVVGFYFAVPAALAAGLLTGSALWVVLVLSASAALSFFLYAHLRRRIAGRECIVALEHVWFALLAMAAALAALRQPVLPYLDVTAPALAIFVAFGRLGCTFAGCCHGVPSTIGIAYPDGVNRRFDGIRLFPVAALEMLALLAIAFTCFLALRLTGTGVTLAWLLISYAFVRYLLEALRGDERPEWLGLSAPRWMCLLQCGAAVLWLTFPGRPLLIAAVVPGALAFALVSSRLDPMRRLLHPRHLAELRELASRPLSWRPLSKESSAGVRIAVSISGQPGRVHVSLSGAGSLVAACRVAAAAFPALDAASARLTGSGVLHFLTAREGEARGEDLYLNMVRVLQAREPGPQPEIQPQVLQPWYFAAPKDHALW